VEKKIVLVEHIGALVINSQMMEYNLAQILVFSDLLEKLKRSEPPLFVDYIALKPLSEEYYARLDKMTLGALNQKLKKTTLFTAEMITKIDEVVEKRNFYLHHFYKEPIDETIFESDEFQDEHIKDLKWVNHEMIHINDFLDEVLITFRTKFEMVRKQIRTELGIEELKIKII